MSIPCINLGFLLDSQRIGGRLIRHTALAHDVGNNSSNCTLIGMNAYKIVNATSYDSRTPNEVIRVLENARQNRTSLHVSLGEMGGGKCRSRLARRV